MSAVLSVAPNPTSASTAAIAVETPGEELVIRGRVDVHTVADLRLIMHEQVGQGSGDLRVDCWDVEVGDATGLGLLMGVHRYAHRAGRRLVLVNVPAQLNRLLHITRLNRVLASDVSEHVA